MVSAAPHEALARDVDSTLLGQAAGKRSLELIASGAGLPDELMNGVTQATKNWGDAGARGYLRVVQKKLEQA